MQVPHVFARAVIVGALDREPWEEVSRRLEELMAQVRLRSRLLVRVRC
jgi:hypothetical protein